MLNLKKNYDEVKHKARLMKALSHPIRLCIVRGLIEGGENHVSAMQDNLNIPQSTLSQHLGKLRNMGIVEGERDGVRINYYVIDEEIIRIVKTLFI